MKRERVNVERDLGLYLGLESGYKGFSVIKSQHNNASLARWRKRWRDEVQGRRGRGHQPPRHFIWMDTALSSGHTGARRRSYRSLERHIKPCRCALEAKKNTS